MVVVLVVVLIIVLVKMLVIVLVKVQVIVILKGLIIVLALVLKIVVALALVFRCSRHRPLPLISKRRMIHRLLLFQGRNQIRVVSVTFAGEISIPKVYSMLSYCGTLA